MIESTYSLIQELRNELHAYKVAHPEHDCSVRDKADAWLTAHPLDLSSDALQKFEELSGVVLDEYNGTSSYPYYERLVGVVRAALEKLRGLEGNPELQDNGITELCQEIVVAASRPASSHYVRLHDDPAFQQCIASALRKLADCVIPEMTTPWNSTLVPILDSGTVRGKILAIATELEGNPVPEETSQSPASAGSLTEIAAAADAQGHDNRDAECVQRWPECHNDGYDPRCCRFPKSCSCGGDLPTAEEKSKITPSAVLSQDPPELTQAEVLELCNSSPGDEMFGDTVRRIWRSGWCAARDTLAQQSAPVRSLEEMVELEIIKSLIGSRPGTESKEAARAVIHAVARWIRQESGSHRDRGEFWANLLQEEADQ